MGYTIATHNGSAVAREHNIRNEKVVNKENHIDPNGVYEIWHDEKVRDAYHRLFDDAVIEYNNKQIRDDRKIDNYYNQIAKDAKKHTAYEMIISIGNRDNMCDEQTGKEIMRDFVDGWRERNPNLELIGAYYHNDEQGVPHVHCDYIPVAHGYTRGMETQTGLVKALGEMGFHKQGKATAQIQWEKRENQTLEELCKARGLEIDHPLEENRQHMHTALYKAQQELSTTIDHTNDLDERNNALERQIERYVGDIKQAKELQDIGRPALFSKDKIVINRSDYDSLQKTAAKVNKVAAKEDELLERSHSINRKAEQLKKEQDKLREREQAIKELEQRTREQAKRTQDILKNQEQIIRQLAEKALQKTYEEELKRNKHKDMYEKALAKMSTIKLGNCTLKDIFLEEQKDISLNKVLENAKKIREYNQSHSINNSRNWDLER